MSSARAIVIHDEKVLVMHRLKNGLEYYSFVGGGLDSGEDFFDAVIREVQEEASMIVRPIKVIAEGVQNKPDDICKFILCEYVSGRPELRQDAEEYEETKLGLNMYKPLWLSFADYQKTSLPIYPDAKQINGIILGYIVDGEWPEGVSTISYIQ